MTYDEFITDIRVSRPQNNKFKHSERHHVVPKCLGGTDDEENLIYLTLKEHFIAHKLLHKENPENRSLFYAYWRMCNGRYNLATPEEYEEAKKLFANTSPMLGKHQTEESNRINSEKHKSENLSPDTRIKLSESKRGDKNPMYGKRSPMAGIYGENNPNYGSKRTEESKKRMSEAQLGEKNHNYGKHLSDETRKKMSEAWKHIVVSEESKRKMSESRKSAKCHVVCKYCGKSFISNSGRANRCEDCKSGISQRRPDTTT